MADSGELEQELAALESHIARLAQDDAEVAELVDAQHDRGRLLMRLRRYEEADAAFRELITEHNADADPKVLYLVALARADRVRCLIRAGRFADADDAAVAFASLYGPDGPLGRADIAVVTLGRAALARWRLGRHDDASGAYAALLDRYRDSEDLRTRQRLAQVLDQAGDLAREEGRHELALRWYDAVIALDRHDDDDDLQFHIAASTFAKAGMLSGMGRDSEAIALWQQLWNRYRDEVPPEWAELPLSSHLNQAITLHQLGFDILAGQVCDEILEHYDPGVSDEVDALVERTLALKLQLIGEHRQPLEVVDAADRILAELEDPSRPELLTLTLGLTRARYWWLLEAVRVDEAVAVSEELLARLRSASDPGELLLLSGAVNSCAESFLRHRRFRRTRKPTTRLAVRLTDAVRGMPPTDSPPPPGGPTTLLAATIDVQRKCLAQARRLWSAVGERLREEDDPRLLAPAIRARIGEFEALLWGLHVLQGARVIEELLGFGQPFADVLGERIEDYEQRGVTRGVIFGWRMLRGMVSSQRAPRPR